MPCDQVRTVSLDMSVANLDILVAALDALGLAPVRTGEIVTFGYGVSYRAGRLTVRDGDQALAGKIAREYSRQAIKRVASSRRWSVREVGRRQVVAARGRR